MTCPYPTKTAFTSERPAKAALRSFRNPHGRMHAYACSGHWHLGHNDRTGRTKAARRGNA